MDPKQFKKTLTNFNYVVGQLGIEALTESNYKVVDTDVYAVFTIQVKDVDDGKMHTIFKTTVKTTESAATLKEEMIAKQAEKEAAYAAETEAAQSLIAELDKAIAEAPAPEEVEETPAEEAPVEEEKPAEEEPAKEEAESDPKE